MQGEQGDDVPHWGTDRAFIWPSPEHIDVPPSPEPTIAPPSEQLVSREVHLDASRAGSQASDELVFDSLHPHPDRVGDWVGVKGPVASADFPQWYAPKSPDDSTCLFESRFESGNLRSAHKVSTWEYNLRLALDINTDRHTQWFYFRVCGFEAGRRYKFNIQNMLKNESVYSCGMQPLVYSEAMAENGVGWHRAGAEIAYFKNQVGTQSKPFYTLTFCYDAEVPQDTVYFAHCFPYRYTELQRYLTKLEHDPLTKPFFRRRSLARTIAGNECDLLTITAEGGGAKQGVVLSSRVHPGETNSSWMMKGAIDFLIGDSLQAASLRQHFCWKIVPMLNPDGVVVGNYRCSLSGEDLNRQYAAPQRDIFPEVFFFKQMMANFKAGREIVLFVDMHGHSKKKNIFCYGCENLTDGKYYLKERVLPTLLSRACSSFSMRDCSFEVAKGKEGCGRVVVRQQLGIVNSYTMEASFMGCNQGPENGLHFNTRHFEEMGHHLCEAVLDLCDPGQAKSQAIHQELLDSFPPMEEIFGERNEGAETDSDDSDMGGGGGGGAGEAEWGQQHPQQQQEPQQQRGVLPYLSPINHQRKEVGRRQHAAGGAAGKGSLTLVVPGQQARECKVRASDGVRSKKAATTPRAAAPSPGETHPKGQQPTAPRRPAKPRSGSGKTSRSLSKAMRLDGK